MFVQAASLRLTVAALQSEELYLPDYLDQLCTRIETVNPRLQALLPEPHRQERLQTEAQTLLNRFPNPRQRPPLFGIPVGIKDIFHVDGFETWAGSRLPPEELAGPEAAIVTRLKSLGALILGKTVTTEFAYFEPGPTRNPHNLEHTPGGSSSGSAAAVAAGLCPLALGTQTIGSIIRPAAYCGIIGFKPTYSRIDPAGVIFVSPSLDHVGLFTQTVTDVLTVAPLVCRQWQSPPDSPPHHSLPVLGIPQGLYLEQASAAALEAFTHQVSHLETAGYPVKRLTVFNNIESLALQHVELMAAEMAAEHKTWFARYADRYRPETRALLNQGQNVSLQTLRQLQKIRAGLRDQLQTLMAEQDIEVWLSPAAPGPAPAGLENTGNPAMNLPWTQAGLPVATIPAGKINNLPVGLQCVGRFMGDEILLSHCLNLEQCLTSVF